LSALLILSILLAIVYALIILYLLVGILRQPDSEADGGELPFVSVVVAARNEAFHIEGCLRALAAQDYPAHLLEIVIVDDRSTDGTRQIVESFAAQFRNLHLICIDNAGEWASSKKNALRTGVADANGSVLLFTDADCVPPPRWIRSHAMHYDESTGLFAAFSPQRSERSEFWNGFLLVDSLASAMVAAGSIGWGKGITCAGRNLSYRKQALEDIDEFAGLPDSVSGDDDFVLQAISRQPHWRVKYSFAKAAQVPAAGPETFAAFLRQKKRHLSSGRHFDLKIKVGYALFHAANYGLWALAVAGLFVNSLLILPFVLKNNLDWSVLSTLARKLSVQFCISHFFYWELLYPIYHLLAGPGAFFGRIQWKSGSQSRT